MAELITIPISYFELSVIFQRPNLKLWADRADVVQGLFDALAPWNVKIEDIEIRTTGTIPEQGINIKIPQKQAAFFFGAAHCKFSRDGVDWATAEETIQILDTALSNLLRLSGVAIGTQQTVIALHFQPRKLQLMEILKPFVAQQFATLDSGQVQTMATIVKWDKRKITIDGSGQLANGVFVRLEREFDHTATYRQIAEQLRADEDALFDALGVKEDIA